MSKNINPREKAEKKQKIKNIVFKIIHGISYVCTGLFVAVCIVSCATSQTKQANAEVYPSEIQYRIEDVSESESETSSEISYPIYDDVSYTITLSAYQLNNYTWNNLNNLMWDDELDFDSYFTSLSYADDVYTFIESNIDYNNECINVNYYFDEANITFNYDIRNSENLNTNKFYYFNAENEEAPFEYNTFILTVDSVIYEDYIKPAIQADIQANEQSDDINVSIFGGISQSITSFIGTLNSGLTAIIGIFWNSSTSALTPLGILTTLVVGVALFYFVFRLIQGLIRLRG